MDVQNLYEAKRDDLEEEDWGLSGELPAARPGSEVKSVLVKLTRSQP